MTRYIIQTDNAPAAIGTYSQAVAVEAARMVYISGQIPLDPQTMEVAAEDLAGQAHRVFKNLRAVAEAAGGGLADCVKLTVYLTDLTKFPTLNEIMAEYFEEPFPARAAIEVSALPKGVAIEIDAIMALA